VQKEFRTKHYVEKLKVILGLKESTLMESCEKLLKLAKGFEERNPSLRNLIKFNSFTLENKGEKSKKR
jgi:hypothetical protein